MTWIKDTELAGGGQCFFVHQLLPYMALVAPAPPAEIPWVRDPNQAMAMMASFVRALYNGDIAVEQQRRPINEESIAAAAAAGAAAGAAAARPQRIPVSDMSTSCKLCSKGMIVDLVNFRPEEHGIKYCDRRCTAPTVAHCSCIEDYMEKNGRASFRLECATPNCSGGAIEHMRSSALKPSEIPVSIWRLCVWLLSSFIVWPIIYYPVVVLFCYVNDLIDWNADPKHFDFPGIPFWTRHPALGAWIIVTPEEKLLAGIFGYWFWWLTKLTVLFLLEVWPLSLLPRLWRRLKRLFFRYR